MLPIRATTFVLSCLGLVHGLAINVGANLQFKHWPWPPKPPQPAKTCLAPEALQTASYYSGLEPGTPGIREGLSESKTYVMCSELCLCHLIREQVQTNTDDSDQANFINFCAGKVLTNGQQNRNGSCNGIPMGRIPATTNMISSIITYPQPGDKITPNTTFTIRIQTRNLRAGYLVNPSSSYYTAPQDLDENGNIIGHCHVTIQEIGTLRTLEPPDPTKFAFFKGIDDSGDGKGRLSTEVTGGLPAGVYRICTMIAARNHQPVVMPVAQRGAQDDCTKFVVGE